MPLPPETSLQMIAVEDIGAMAAQAFHMPQRLIGEALEIAGDELTMPQVAAMFSSVIGRKVACQQLPLEEVSNPDARVMFEWFIRHGYKADIAGLRSMQPDLLTFETWLRRAGWVGAAETLAARKKTA